MRTAEPCTHAWQLEGVALGDAPLAWWWCHLGCGAAAVGEPTYDTSAPGLLIPVLYVGQVL
jgi:hypothetical protein